MIQTSRLMLVPATVALAQAEITDRAEFAGLLNAVVPATWPPESLVDALPLFLSWIEAAPDQTGWFSWYAVSLQQLTSDSPKSDGVLVGGGGFLGPPAEGAVQMGYSVLPEFQNLGIATELVNGLTQWAFNDPSLHHINAETEWANPASYRVLSKTGFRCLGPGGEPEGQRFVLSRSDKSGMNSAAG